MSANTFEQQHFPEASGAGPAARSVTSWLSLAETALANTSDRLNAINIFPVPDGDTGTNLYLTIKAARAALLENDLVEDTVGAMLSTAGRAALDNARGNSGTLMAVILTGLAEPMGDAERLTAPLLALGLDRARTAAWSALSDPQEGTMLTVLGATAAAAAHFTAALEDHSTDRLNSRKTLAECCSTMVEVAWHAVKRTESELAQLRQANVVDAGGMGLLLVLEALRATVHNEPMNQNLLQGLHGAENETPHLHQHMQMEEGHEIMCSLELTPLDAASLRFELDTVGDSVIMSPISSTEDEHGLVRWRLHVHVVEAPAALELIRRAGEPQNLVITALHSEEHHEHHHQEEGTSR